ncbi:asparagine synthetase domain-containing protein 1 [Pleomassaria siparia CBS 279.74]|uniref:Asparagine synthetase domain-containing protein 1 n=1 Tax=Pleomassaria siparia CBS 279.74 TaxID=1314801 RepID=A0A6G1K892_9PLEO|nr:asparagine synthetase domain-containing protein 1 [Pleomassaria siparia CBS 279.74]
MCGIFFSISRHKYVVPDAGTKQALQNRGPDSSGGYRILIPAEHDREQGPSLQLFATAFSTVLSLRGTAVVKQPLQNDDTGSMLCWNGEAWSIQGHSDPVVGNDSQLVFDLLLQQTSSSLVLDRCSSVQRTAAILSAIRGPYAFVFYDAINQYLYYGRDCLGRRSLLRKFSLEHDLILSSVCDNATGDQWEEVEADGINVIDLKRTSSEEPLTFTHIPHRRRNEVKPNELSFHLPFPAMNTTVESPSHPEAQHVQKLGEALRRSLEARTQHVRESVNVDTEAKVAILFSGGLDCTVLARICHDLLPPTEAIHLHNVAFQNPRIHSNLGENESPYELCPDRVTGRSSYAELMRICPGRQWRFVEINVPYTATVAHRSNVMALMHPHNTEMDLSISYALYFAARGYAMSQPHPEEIRVLLSGLGADELFGGYQRHSLAFARRGYSGLIEELELDFNRLGKRNLGRDDRVISNSGKEVRFPYLDEELISLALDLPVWAKCDFANSQMADSEDPARFLEPEKRLLRLLAWDLGMKGVAAEKKRAIQFGARTAKMEAGRTKGTQVLS